MLALVVAVMAPVIVVSPPTHSVVKLQGKLFMPMRLLVVSATSKLLVPSAFCIWKAAVELLVGFTVTPVLLPPSGLIRIPPVPDWTVVVDVVLVEPSLVVCALAAVPKSSSCPEAASTEAADAAPNSSWLDVKVLVLYLPVAVTSPLLAMTNTSDALFCSSKILPLAPVLLMKMLLFVLESAWTDAGPNCTKPLLEPTTKPQFAELCRQIVPVSAGTVIV